MAEDLCMGKKQEDKLPCYASFITFNRKQYHDEIEVRLDLHTSHWWMQETLPSHKFRFYLANIISSLTRNGFYHYSPDQ